MNTILLNTIPLDGGKVIKKGGTSGGGGESGGGGASASAGAVNFRDYDGTILRSYSKDEFLALNEFPPLPTQKGLICQDWNWSIGDAKEYVAEYGVLDIGANYITDDGKTRLYIRIAERGRMKVTVFFFQAIENGVTIDWGDGSASYSVSGTGARNSFHTYNDIGDYCISLDVAEGCSLALGNGSTQYSVMGSTGQSGRVYCNMLQKVEIGEGVTDIGAGAFYNCTSLASVVIPQGVTRIFSYAFNNCTSLASVVIPQGVTSIDEYTFNECYSLASVVIPQGVTSILNFTFYKCYSLASVVIPQGVTSISTAIFGYCHCLASVVIPQGVTSIGGGAFNNCASLASVVIPQGVTSIGTNTFNSCSGIAFYDFRTLEYVPTLAATNAFSSIASDSKIIVPDALYDEWIAATNWSTYASKIVKASEYNG